MKNLLVKIWRKAKNSRVQFTDKTIYQTMPNGEVRRISPSRPWAGKSERREVIKNRREDRQLAIVNRQS